MCIIARDLTRAKLKLLPSRVRRCGESAETNAAKIAPFAPERAIPSAVVIHRYAKVSPSISLSLAHVSCLSVCGGCTSCSEGCAQMLHGANGLGVAGEIRKGPCARNTLPVRARYTPMSVYISMTGKALHRPNAPAPEC